MEKTEITKREEGALKMLLSVEDLAEKKMKIYSRLLTDAALAGNMEQLAMRHEKRKESLELLIFGKAQKRGNGQGRCATNSEEGE